jgi:hypothetical protein
LQELKRAQRILKNQKLILVQELSMVDLHLKLSQLLVQALDLPNRQNEEVLQLLVQ